MGVAIAQSALDSGCDVFWASDGRGPGTRQRAARAGLIDLGTIERLCEACAVILSVCPPEFAADVAASEAITLEAWRDRPMGDRMSELMAQLWRYWL